MKYVKSFLFFYSSFEFSCCFDVLTKRNETTEVFARTTLLHDVSPCSYLFPFSSRFGLFSLDIYAFESGRSTVGKLAFGRGGTTRGCAVQTSSTSAEQLCFHVPVNRSCVFPSALWVLYVLIHFLSLNEHNVVKNMVIRVFFSIFQSPHPQSSQHCHCR